MGTCAVGGEAVGVAGGKCRAAGPHARAVWPRAYARASAEAPRLRSCMSWARKTRIRTTSRSAPPSLPAANSRASRRKRHLRRHPPRERAEQPLALRRTGRGRRDPHAHPGRTGPCPRSPSRLRPRPQRRALHLRLQGVHHERAARRRADARPRLPRGAAPCGETVAAQTVTANHQRRNAVSFDGTLCDSVRVHVLATNGCEEARIYEIRVY